MSIESTDLSLPVLESYAVANKIALYPDLATLIQSALANRRRSNLPEELRARENNSMFARAVWFYYSLIKPLVVRAGDARKVTPADVSQFCRMLANKQHINVVLYYTFSKVPSCSRSGSPDGVIDFAELEMLKYFATVTRVASALGFSLHIRLIDETPIFPSEILGLTAKDRTITSQIATDYLTKIGAVDSVSIRPITRSVIETLGKEFDKLYAVELQANLNQIVLELSDDKQTRSTTLMLAWLKCLSDQTFTDKFGLSFTEIDEIRQKTWSPGQLLHINQTLLSALTDAAGHFLAIMNLRQAAKQTVLEYNLLAAYPEYDEATVLHVGVARSRNRWSILPHPVRYQGQTRNPSYGLALYDQSGDFRGIVEYAQFQAEPTAKIIRHGTKPLAIINISHNLSRA